MTTTECTHNTSSLQATRDYDVWIIVAYGILGSIMLAALYFASGGPGNGDASLAVTLAMP